ncbi:MAG: hypothetical protein K2N75_01275 [Helicobacter sp.]|uniref:hypothetical protein n=1 Tax=Helicobacter sp. TaxID=218 RepID=UPI0023C03394|nr:hypothetical protein [Helicobacter sp.]MDE7174668.1 hypothetical protein [Helicobacter sp.]
MRLIEITCFALLAFVSWQVILLVESLGGLGDPIATLYFWSGWICIFLLSLSLIAPKYKREIGLTAFVVGILHSGIFVILDFGWNLALIFTELKQKYYLYFGVLSFLCLMTCTLGSLWGFQRFKLYYLAYLALGFGLVHLLMIQKILTLHYLVLGIGIGALIIYKLFRKFYPKCGNL